MPVLSNSRHERFAQELAKGKTATEAYELAGFASNDSNAARLNGNERIRVRVAELLGKGAERAAVTIESLILEADDIQRKAIVAEQYSAATSALTAKAKLAGLWVEKSEREITRHFVARIPEKSASTEKWQSQNLQPTIQ